MVVVRGHRRWMWLRTGVVVLVVAGCGPATVAPPVSTTTPTADAHAPLVAVLDAPFGAVPNSVHLVALDGTEVASMAIRPDAEAIAVAGSEVLIAGGGRLDAVDRTGADIELGAIPDDTSADLVRGLVASPDGSQWLWASLRVMADGAIRSRIYLDDDGAGPRLVLEHTEQGHSLQPVAWTAAGPVLSDEVDGIGGYVLFRRSFGAASHLDLATGALTQLTSDTCAFNDLAPGGMVTCVVDSREGPNDGGVVRLTVRTANGTAIVVPLGTDVHQAGDALFQPQGPLITIASSPATGAGTDAVHTAFVDSRGGAMQPVVFNGLQPVQWISTSSLLLTRGLNISGGPPGTYVGNLEGTATKVSPHPYALGIVR